MPANQILQYSYKNPYCVILSKFLLGTILPYFHDHIINNNQKITNSIWSPSTLLIFLLSPPDLPLPVCLQVVLCTWRCRHHLCQSGAAYLGQLIHHGLRAYIRYI